MPKYYFPPNINLVKENMGNGNEATPSVGATPERNGHETVMDSKLSPEQMLSEKIKLCDGSYSLRDFADIELGNRAVEEILSPLREFAKKHQPKGINHVYEFMGILDELDSPVGHRISDFDVGSAISNIPETMFYPTRGRNTKNKDLANTMERRIQDEWENFNSYFFFKDKPFIEKIKPLAKATEWTARRVG